MEEFDALSEKRDVQLNVKEAALKEALATYAAAEEAFLMTAPICIESLQVSPVKCWVGLTLFSKTSFCKLLGKT